MSFLKTVDWQLKTVLLLYFPQPMNLFSQKRAWFWIAVAAIFIALLALLVPHVHSTGQPDWLALLPIFFIGLIVPLSLTPSRAFLPPDRAPETPALVPSFQRPPPFLA